VSSQKGRFTQIAVILTIISFMMAYFNKPHGSAGDLVPSTYPNAHKPNITIPLSTRVAHSYTLAMILVRSDYTPGNATALEALRNWANRNFEKDSNFLHPAALESTAENSQSIVDSYSFSLLQSTRYFFEELMANFLSWRIRDFETSDSYKSFCDDYYDLLGRDFDSDQLLARYQTERAREAADPMLVLVFWFIVSGAILFKVWRKKTWSINDRLQFALTCTWLSLAGFYMVAAWTQNQIAVLVSAIFCLAVGLYLRRPVKIAKDPNGAILVQTVNLSSPVLALTTWLTVSLLLIRIVAWIKTGSLLHSDPITLIISGLRGDFVHDPVHVKRNIDRMIGLLWLAFTLWTIPRLGGEWTAEGAQEEPLRAIQKPLY
jgi:hypothetical protein